MKLYVCLTAYHILSACTLGIMDEDGDAELLVEGVTDEEPELVRSVRKLEIFRDIHYVNQSGAWEAINKLDIHSQPVEIKKAVEVTANYWKGVFVHFDTIKERYSEIKIWDDHFTLGVIMSHYKIPYDYYEESPGCHYRRDVFIELSEKRITNKAFAPLAKYYGVRGESASALSYNYDFELNPIDRGDKDKDFSVVKELQKIKDFYPDKYGRIRQVFIQSGGGSDFYINSYDKMKKNFLLIGQHYSVSTYKSFNIIKYSLYLLADYFGEDMNIWIKEHPSNYFNPISYWFPAANYVADNIPMELIATDDRFHFDRVAAVSSSAPLVMKTLGTEVILFQNSKDGDSFETKKRFLDLHKYYITLKLIEALKKSFKLHRIYGYGVEELSLDYLMKYQTSMEMDVEITETSKQLLDIGNKTDEARCFIIDCNGFFTEEIKKLKHTVTEWLSSLTKNDIVFFINGESKNTVLEVENPKIWAHIYPLPIDVIDHEGDSDLFGYGELEYPLQNTIGKLHQEGYHRQEKKERQIIYMYTEDSTMCKTILTSTVKKKLEHCGLEIVYEPNAMNYREYVFESMLEQLELQFIELREQNLLLRRLTVEQRDIIQSCMKSGDVKPLFDTLGINSRADNNQLLEMDRQLIKCFKWYGIKKKGKEKIKKVIKKLLGR